MIFGAQTSSYLLYSPEQQQTIAVINNGLILTCSRLLVSRDDMKKWAGQKRASRGCVVVEVGGGGWDRKSPPPLEQAFFMLSLVTDQKPGAD